MIMSAKEFVELRARDDPRATDDYAYQRVWLEVLKYFPEYKEWVAHNKTVPISILRELARDSDVSIRFVVAMKRSCPIDVFRLLASDKEESVRVRVAWNARTPFEILEILKDDPCKEVAEVASDRLKQ